MQKGKDYSAFIGNKYNFLTVVGIANSRFYMWKSQRKERKRFLVQCDCGTIKEVDCQNVLRNNTVSCGCHREKILPHIHKLVKKISDAPERKEYRNYLYGANKRGIDFTLSYEDFLNLSYGSCVYCGAAHGKDCKNETGSKHKLLNGIDRVDSNKGYTIDNCVSCCSKCNYMKGRLSVREFVDHIINLVNHMGRSDIISALYPGVQGRE